MTEEEYIRATNRVKVSLAIGIMRDVLPGVDYGISDDDHKKIMVALMSAEEDLFKSYKLMG